MIAEVEKRIKEKITDALLDWAYRYEIETTSEMERDVANLVFDSLEEEFKEE